MEISLKIENSKLKRWFSGEYKAFKMYAWMKAQGLRVAALWLTNFKL